MKTCYMCGGDFERRIVDVEVEGVIVKDVPMEVCTRCDEKYFNTKAATFVQKIRRYVNDAKKGVFNRSFQSLKIRECCYPLLKKVSL